MNVYITGCTIGELSRLIQKLESNHPNANVFEATIEWTNEHEDTSVSHSDGEVLRVRKEIPIGPAAGVDS